ncbi:MAG: protein kinase [Deltaproteobacteria bacterium]|nr:protein kinase [Deltaproteobacteria bacterium]
MSERGALDQLPTSTLGQYEIRAKLGSGGMGDVYDAVHTSLDKRVAIKTLRRRFLEDEVVVARFLREGQLASRIRHPNIVDITDVGMIGGVPCLVMEHLEGGTLGEHIKRGALATTMLVDLLLPIVAAVDFAHERGVVHRDLKPSNIFLSRSWNGEVTPKVLDFGISKLVSESTEAALTTDSAFIGTPHYASPESMRADKTADRRADIYSMGVILYEGVAGVRPFVDKGGNLVSMAMAICAGDYPPLASVRGDLPEGFVKVVERAMALKASDRYATMRDLGAALLPFASDRARMIWKPTFETVVTSTVAASPETFVLPEQGMTAVMPNPMSANGPAAPPASWPSHASGHVQVPPSMPVPISGPPSGRAPSSGTPGITSFSQSVPHLASLPPAYHDRTPSFGAGTGTPFTSAPRQKTSATVYVAVAMVMIALLVGGGVLLTRRPSAATTPDGPTASLGDTFTIDVRVTPESAAIEVDGVAAGAGHLVRQLPRDKQSHVLRISAPGHEALLVSFDEQRPPPSMIVLRASAATVIAPSSSVAPIKPPTAFGPTHPVQPPGVGPVRQPPPVTAPKGKTDRPRTDNIDPWE